MDTSRRSFLKGLAAAGGATAAAARDGELVQRSIDELHRMRDGIDLGHAIAASPDLVAALTGESVAPTAAGEPAAGGAR